MEEIKNKILLKAAEMYQQFGIKSISMDDISRALGISKKTLYTVFPNKQALVHDAIFYIRHSNRSKWIEFMKGSENAIEEMLKANYVISSFLSNQTPWVDYDLEKYYPETFSKLEEDNKTAMHEEVIKNIRKGKQEGLFRMDADEEVIALLLIARVSGLKQTIKENTLIKYDKHFNDQVFMYHLRGLASQKGIDFVEENYDKLMQSFEDKIKIL